MIEEFVVVDKKDRKDVPWWYNERASLSLFAGAVWLKDGWAFEEYSTQKRLAKWKKRGKTHPGRCDIQFGLSDRITFVAEAKQAWPTIRHRKESGISTVKAYLKEAQNDSSKLPDKEGTKLGMVFVVPRILRSRRKQLKGKQIDEILKSFLKQLSKIKNATMVWVFPKKTRMLFYRGDDYCYPGIVLLIQRSRRKRC